MGTLDSDEGFNLNKLLVGSMSHTRTIGRLTTVSTFAASRHELDAQSGYRNAGQPRNCTSVKD
jgi:hypothetical protein